ncbi:hypothetical protein yrohd0001_25700 [Yersinia rohdei ATCC 43380]|nr:hypothetical protein yrohd0001_25700 [Yersinia rohdei ATCC 43380]
MLQNCALRSFTCATDLSQLIVMYTFAAWLNRLIDSKVAEN